MICSHSRPWHLQEVICDKNKEVYDRFNYSACLSLEWGVGEEGERNEGRGRKGERERENKEGRGE